MLVCRTDLDRNFDRIFGRTFGDIAQFSQTATTQKVPLDLFETDTSFVLRADVPGIERDALDVTLKEGLLTVSGSRELPDRETKRAFVRERGKTHFERSFELPSPVDAEGVAARLSNGVLEVTVPKIPESVPRRIEIAVS